MAEPITVLKRTRKAIVADRKKIADDLAEAKARVQKLQALLSQIDAEEDSYDAAIITLSTANPT
jgi:F0F1-type ATP synthase membrane subunit b/b'